MSQSKSEDVSYYTDLPVGEILRRTRLHYGLTLERVEVILKIRASQLEAIEKGEFEKLPGRVYAIGFVRAYSESLGLDGDRMVQLFKSQCLGVRSKPEINLHVPASESKVPSVWIIASSVAGLIAIIVAWFIIGGSGGSAVSQIEDVPSEIAEQVNSLPPEATGVDAASLSSPEEKPAIGEEVVSFAFNEMTVPEGEGAEAETAAEATATAEETPETAPAAPTESEKRVTLEVSERSWVEIKDSSGKVILSRNLEPGNSYFVPSDRGDLMLSTGNAAGLQITVDGRTLPSFGKRGDVKRNIPLNADKLNELYKP